LPGDQKLTPTPGRRRQRDSSPPEPGFARRPKADVDAGTAASARQQPSGTGYRPANAARIHPVPEVLGSRWQSHCGYANQRWDRAKGKMPVLRRRVLGRREVAHQVKAAYQAKMSGCLRMTRMGWRSPSGGDGMSSMKPSGAAFERAMPRTRKGCRPISGFQSSMTCSKPFGQPTRLQGTGMRSTIGHGKKRWQSDGGSLQRFTSLMR